MISGTLISWYPSKSVVRMVRSVGQLNVERTVEFGNCLLFSLKIRECGGEGILVN